MAIMQLLMGLEENVEVPKADMQSQQFGFTPEQYQGLLALLQQSQVRSSVSNQVSVAPSTSSGQDQSTHDGCLLTKTTSSLQSHLLTL
ncbi:hypothetical protein SESBI_12246 [Sesbania bispinosa]|nr:hypothetical protein SESBI_12246 [Sesbania bispinosa]